MLSGIHPDIVDMSALENRIDTLVSVACADRNYLFGLPPMLDGQPKPGKTSGAWLAEYGESVAGVRGCPWLGCVFRGNIIYVHGDATPPAIPAKLVSSKKLFDRILKIEYDQSTEPFALAAPSIGSLTAGKSGMEVDFGKPETFDRLEFTIENPGYRRGLGKRFDPVTAQHVRLNVGAPVRQFDLLKEGK